MYETRQILAYTYSGSIPVNMPDLPQLDMQKCTFHVPACFAAVVYLSGADNISH